MAGWSAYAQEGNNHGNENNNSNKPSQNENSKGNGNGNGNYKGNNGSTKGNGNGWGDNKKNSNQNGLNKTTGDNQNNQIDLSHKTFHNNNGNTDPNRTNHWSNNTNQQNQNNNQTWKTNQGNNNYTNQNQPKNHFQKNNNHQNNQDINTSRFQSVQPSGSNVAHHHHPYTQGYVRKKLQKVGVKQIPDYIKDRRGILDADKNHSTIHYPDHDPEHHNLNNKVISSKEFNNTVVVNRMNLVQNENFTVQINNYTTKETLANHYYWHRGDGFNYCHYVDNWGYHWYGWYEGDSCFWVRYYGARWWCYDDVYGRWCFWDDDRWWWQDPDHVGDLYLYNDGGYIAADSANDPVVNTTQGGNETIYNSPDGSRTVKIMTDTGDAFLFDTAIPPNFNPIYLASNVSGVKFTNTSDGSQLEVMLTLNDGTFDIFDDQGNAINFSDGVVDDSNAENNQ
jgi:hypothetical protein